MHHNPGVQILWEGMALTEGVDMESWINWFHDIQIVTSWGRREFPFALTFQAMSQGRGDFVVLKVGCYFEVTIG